MTTPRYRLERRLRGGLWVSAEAATLLTRLDVFLDRNNLAAILPTRFDVFSFRAIANLLWVH